MDRFIATGLIEAHELEPFLYKKTARIRLIDASYSVTSGTAGPKSAFAEDHLPGAIFFDVDEIADPASPLAHTLPSPEEFAKAVTSLGIDSEDMIVVYDQSGVALAAARAWWMFRVFGHDRVCVLNGGLPEWRRAGLPLEKGVVQSIEAECVFTPAFNQELVRNSNDIVEANQTIIDARATERYRGLIAEPRSGLRRGHIPGSFNFPYSRLIGPDGRMASIVDLSSRLRTFKARDNIIVYCGSGITACVVALAFYVTGKQNVAVYDGSWAEWGQETQSFPVKL